MAIPIWLLPVGASTGPNGFWSCVPHKTCPEEIGWKRRKDRSSIRTTKEFKCVQNRTHCLVSHEYFRNPSQDNQSIVIWPDILGQEEQGQGPAGWSHVDRCFLNDWWTKSEARKIILNVNSYRHVTISFGHFYNPNPPEVVQNKIPLQNATQI